MFQPLVDVWTFCLGNENGIQIQPVWTDLEDLLFNIFIKTEEPEVERGRGFAADCSAAIIPLGHDLGVPSSLSLG